MKSLWRRMVLPGRVLSPRSLMLRAAVPLLIFLALHACGLRRYTTLITGTSPDGAPIDSYSMGLAFVYVMSHLGAVVVTPILALAGLVWAGCLYLRDRGAERPESSQQ